MTLVQIAFIAGTACLLIGLFMVEPLQIAIGAATCAVALREGRA
jgi:hypothetical protein